MTKTLLAIHSYKAARNRVWRNWPFYKIPGWDILGVDASNGTHDWPENVPVIHLGKDSYLERDDNLCRKLLNTYFHVLSSPQFSSYTHICIIEHDGLFLRKPPEHPGGLWAHLAGHCSPEWKTFGDVYLHTPWWADRATASKICEAGGNLLKRGIIENGTPDCFLGAIVKEGKIECHYTNENFDTWSCNSGMLSIPRVKTGLMKALQNGVWYVHGIKTDEELQLVKPYSKFS